jgi:DNA/RNA-binding domain of Phe-tRNA-synthetase-like protein
MDLKISIDASLTEIIKLGIIQVNQVQVVKRIDALDKEIETLCLELRRSYHSTADAMERLKVTRSLYRGIGIDPTKNRPSSEALLRRVLKGNPLYQVNSIVDICNFCSLKFLLSLGLYNVDKIRGSIKLRLGKEGEGYEGIRKEYINVAGRFTLVDDLGPFGNPSADSARTMITEKTDNVLFVIFAPADYQAELLAEHLDFIETKVKQYHSCDIVLKNLVN